MSGTSLYETDIVAWAEEQVAALRRLARSPASSPNAVDWNNVIEEIESLGRSERDAVASLIENALVHILKGYCDSDSLSVRQWERETRAFLRQARKKITPTIRQRLHMDALWREAGAAAADELTLYEVRMPPALPSRCPFVLDELMDERFDYEKARWTLHRLVDKPASPGELP